MNLSGKITLNSNGCWVWYKDVKLPRVRVAGKMQVVRRVLWTEQGFPLEAQQRLVADKPNCVGRLCVNPAHASLVEQAHKPRQTACKFGHLLTAENRSQGNSARCKECIRKNSRHYNHIRRLVETSQESDKIDDALVFERDDWVCQVCSKKVDRTLSRRHPKGATLDHVIPLAKGGTHTYVNVQLAHGSCNFKKWMHLERGIK